MSTTVSTSYQPISAPPQSDIPHAPQPRRRGWVTALNAVPNLVAFGMLGGVLYFGHHTGSKMPKMSELMGTAAVAGDDWGAEHLVSASA